MYLTIGELFEQTVLKFGNKLALVDRTRNVRWTYNQWNEQVNKLANALSSAGVRKGDRVSTLLFNTYELATVYFATAKIGAILNPINFRLKAEEIAYILKDAAPKIIMFEKALEDEITKIHAQFPNMTFWSIDEPIPSYASSYHEITRLALPTNPTSLDLSENETYAIMYTSGTTGRPKGVMHRHRDMVEQSLICISSIGIKTEVIGLVTAPMFHCAELHCSFLPRVHAGATNVIIHHFDPNKVLEEIKEERITMLFAAPTMWNMLLEEKLDDYDISSLKIGLYGAAPMAPILVNACKERLGIDLVQAYGMTEMGPAITFLGKEEQLTKAGSAGRACFNHEIRIVKPNDNGPSEPEDMLPAGEVGEIIVKGPCMMIGYFNRKEATEKALYKGWYHSGDLGYVDHDGYLYVADRVDDMVISGGENIYPREVEDFLYEHDGVLDVAVLGEPDELWGERVIAIVVKKQQNVTAEELELFCENSEKLAPYKRPRRYIFVEELPRNASGKIQKFLLREHLQHEEIKKL
ncbi:fatty-acyl-CoA synthase [Metabacillus crassostreae]|uniref:fatty acid--CoA ligase n=1 Tax=Metabacillus crassostreae TaxID=929098 RepID=UPI00195F223B|nr:fatty acid--CoA ligase [Metabacillus crassostreae]MBM7603182.1 fatty-acyl-CoA synthase [Metabacillus crassostreae]